MTASLEFSELIVNMRINAGWSEKRAREILSLEKSQEIYPDREASYLEYRGLAIGELAVRQSLDNEEADGSYVAFSWQEPATVLLAANRFYTTNGYSDDTSTARSHEAVDSLVDQIVTWKTSLGRVAVDLQPSAGPISASHQL